MLHRQLLTRQALLPHWACSGACCASWPSMVACFTVLQAPNRLLQSTLQQVTALVQPVMGHALL